MRSRPLVVLISVLILLSSVFFVSSSAASTGNLISSDLTSWECVGDSSLSKKGKISRISLTGSDSDIVYDVPKIVSGHSYTLSFYVPNGKDITSVWGVSYTDAFITNYYKDKCTVDIGYGYMSDDGVTLETSYKLFTLSSSNISNYLGKSLTSTFTAKGGSGTPCVYIFVYCPDSGTNYYFFSNFSLVDNDDDSAHFENMTSELTGIKGFLHSIRWDIVGGVCDESSCPNSSKNNPHLSIAQRVASAFEEFFTGLGNLLLYFDWEGDYENPFANDDDTVSQLSDRLTEISDYISGVGDSFSEIVDSITGTMDLFTRFVERYDWLLSLCVFTLAFLVISRFIGI